VQQFCRLPSQLAPCKTPSTLRLSFQAQNPPPAAAFFTSQLKDLKNPTLLFLYTLCTIKLAPHNILCKGPCSAKCPYYFSIKKDYDIRFNTSKTEKRHREIKDIDVDGVFKETVLLLGGE
jgi:hypothetical protein